MKGKKTTSKRRKYSADFKSEVVKMLLNGQSAAKISQQLGISENLIYRWKNEQVAQSNSSNIEEKTVSVGELLQKVEQLQRQLREVETEREILKKVVAIFSKSP